MTTQASGVTRHSIVLRSLLRGVLWLVTRLIYRVRVLGQEHVPLSGGALFVCNHGSFVDPLFVGVAMKRHARFIMFEGTHDLPWVKPFARVLGVIPISNEQSPREMIKSLQTASEAIRNGEFVFIFAEGQITRTGQLLPFRRGFERIMKDLDAPIIPVAIDGVWGSIFSFEGGRFLWKWPRPFRYPITVNFGSPLPAAATSVEVRQSVQELLTDAWPMRRERMKPLHREFVSMARLHPFRFAMADAQTRRVTFGGALTRTVLLARRLKRIWAGQEMAGLLLPPGVAGALVNWAAMLCGKVPVNLNYTLPGESLASCVKQCGIKTVLTSRVFVEKVKLTVPGEVVFLEDVVGTPSVGEKFTAFLIARCLPVRWIEFLLRGSPRKEVQKETLDHGRQGGLDALATVIFSSGSTGEPKGVMLSHYNIGSNIQQLRQSFAFSRTDKVLGVLPFFHSFGFTGTLALPSVLGLGVVFHANPLDPRTIGALVAEHKVTFLLATPTFLQLYMRGCTPEQFGSVRLVAVGAEKLPDRLATAFEEQFGIRPFEAYGCTECSPAVTVNTHDFRAPGFRQVGGKRGKIGHPLPGVCVRIVDPANPRAAVSLPVDQSGLLLVRGPNVMLGYLGNPEKTAEVLVAAGKMADSIQHWYITGDIAAMDEDGFVQITDRLSRFSKIGGEMVPHIRVEERLHELACATEQSFVVMSLADEKKGERLVVLHKLSDVNIKSCLEKLTACDLPNLWKPKADAFLKVEMFPMLGSGKLDLRKVREVAERLASTTGGRE